MADAVLNSSSALSPNESNKENNFDDCYMYPAPYIEERIWLVTGFGSILSIISLIGNVILVCLFFLRPHFRRSTFAYLAVLSVLDCFHSVSYFMVMSVAVLYDYLRSVSLAALWYSYFLEIYTVSHISLVASVYLLVGMSFERFLGSQILSNYYNTNRRFVVIGAILAFATFSKATMYWEFYILHRPHCTGLAEYIVVPTELYRNKEYQTIWMFWYRNIVSTFLPFCLLLILNLGIVLKLKWSCLAVEKDEFGAMRFRFTLQRQRSSLDDSFLARRRQSLQNAKKVNIKTSVWVQRARARVRKSATRSLLAIAIEYLICTSLSGILTVWEHVDIEDLRGRVKFWTYASDITSLLTVISCAIRLPTYCLCDVTLRHELVWMLKCMSCRATKKSVCAAEAPVLSSKSNIQTTSVPKITSIHQLFVETKSRNTSLPKNSAGDSKLSVLEVESAQKKVTFNLKNNDDDDDDDDDDTRGALPISPPKENVKLIADKQPQTINSTANRMRKLILAAAKEEKRRQTTSENFVPENSTLSLDKENFQSEKKQKEREIAESEIPPEPLNAIDMKICENQHGIPLSREKLIDIRTICQYLRKPKSTQKATGAVTEETNKLLIPLLTREEPVDSPSMCKNSRESKSVQKEAAKTGTKVKRNPEVTEQKLAHENGALNQNRKISRSAWQKVKFSAASTGTLKRLNLLQSNLSCNKYRPEISEKIKGRIGLTELTPVKPGFMPPYPCATEFGILPGASKPLIVPKSDSVVSSKCIPCCKKCTGFLMSNPLRSPAHNPQPLRALDGRESPVVNFDDLSNQPQCSCNISRMNYAVPELVRTNKASPLFEIRKQVRPPKLCRAKQAVWIRQSQQSSTSDYDSFDSSRISENGTLAQDVESAHINQMAVQKKFGLYDL